jgi:hypothetical protein
MNDAVRRRVPAAEWRHADAQGATTDGSSQQQVACVDADATTRCAARVTGLDARETASDTATISITNNNNNNKINKINNNATVRV